MNGDFATSVDTAFYAVLGLSTVLLIGITVAMVYFLYRYSEKRHKTPVDIHGNLWLEISWTVIPTFLVMGMFMFGLYGYTDMTTPPENAMVVKTNGYMWGWRFEYENGAKSDSVMHVPANTPVLLKLSATDVIHSFYLPTLRVKRDVVPGVDNEMWFVVEEPDTLTVFCAEYCGERHSRMIGKVVALEKSAFDQWYASAGGGKKPETAAVAEMPPATPASKTVSQPSPKAGQKTPAKTASMSLDPALVKTGEGLWTTKTCFACHSIDGSTVIGPSMKGLYGKKEIVITQGAERQITVDEAYLARSIREPDADKVKGFEAQIMAPIPVNDSEMAALIAYIKSLK